MGRRTLILGYGLLLALGCGGSATTAHKLRFEGTDLTEGDLSIRKDAATSTIVIASSARRFSVRLPQSDDWAIESSIDASLYAESPKLGLNALLSDDHAGAVDFEEQTALMQSLYLSSRAFNAKANPGGIRKEGGIQILMAIFPSAGKSKEDVYLAATARQAPWQHGPNYRTLTLTLRKVPGSTLVPTQLKDIALQDFRTE